MENKPIKTFYTLLGFTLFFIVLARLFYLQVVEHDFYESIVKSQSETSVKLTIGRGEIVDYFGNVLARDRRVAYLFVDGQHVEDVKELESVLREYGLPFNESTKKRIEDGKRFVYLLRGIDISTAEIINEKLPYVNYRYEYARDYPQGDLMSGILGRTDVDNKGLGGIEGYYDEQLKGEVATIPVLRDSVSQRIMGTELLTLFKEKPYVRLTVPAPLQAYVEKKLDDGINDFRAESGMAVGIDLDTGNILFMASRFSPASSIVRSNQQNEKSYVSGWTYEPGSTFKAITYAYLIDKGLFQEDRNIDISKAFTVSNITIKDSQYNGNSISHKDAFTKSSNIGTSQLMRSVSSEDYFRFLKRLKFGEKVGLEGVYEESGLLRADNDWSAVSKYSIGFGQEISTTPLQIALFYAAIANDGRYIKPRVVSEHFREDSLTELNATEETVLSPEVAQKMQYLMREVVLNGSGRNVNSDLVSIAGKTGTAQVYDNSRRRYSDNRYIASFAGFFPYEEPRIAMLVLYDSPKTSIYGGATAGVTFRELSEYLVPYLGIKVAGLSQ